jgi:hypothetical protein
MSEIARAREQVLRANNELTRLLDQQRRTDLLAGYARYLDELNTALQATEQASRKIKISGVICTLLLLGVASVALFNCWSPCHSGACLGGCVSIGIVLMFIGAFFLCWTNCRGPYYPNQYDAGCNVYACVGWFMFSPLGWFVPAMAGWCWPWCIRQDIASVKNVLDPDPPLSGV